MKFKEFDDLIMNTVLMQPLSEDGFGGDENEYYAQHKERIYKTLQVLPTGGVDVLDIGCEPGYMPIALKAMDYNVTAGGVNLIKDFKNRMDRFQITIDVYNVDIDDLPYSNGQYDVVIFSEVIEHLFYGVPHALNEINRVLKEGGSLILTTPNLARLVNRIRLSFGKSVNPAIYGGKPFFQRDIYKRHNREYTFGELVQLLENANFKIDKYFYWNYPASKSKPLLKHTVNFISEIVPKSKDMIFIIASKNKNL